MTCDPCSPPAPLRKRMKKSTEPVQDALLLIATDDAGEVATYSSNSTILRAISGHCGDIEMFFTDELFESVLSVVGGGGYSSVNRGMYLVEEVVAMKKAALLKLFSREMYGGGPAQEGEMFRGTIVL